MATRGQKVAAGAAVGAGIVGLAYLLSRPKFTLSVSPVDVSLEPDGSEDVSFTVTPSGGVPPYTYDVYWNNGYKDLGLTSGDIRRTFPPDVNYPTEALVDVTDSSGNHSKAATPTT